MTAQESIQAALQAGPRTAVEIQSRTGLSHEDVYEALVHMEALGQVQLRIWDYAVRTARVWVM